MKGLILRYIINDAREITKINNIIFGKVIQLKRNNNKHLYYYKGLLHNTGYYKLSNGCYFIPTGKIIANIVQYANHIELISADLFLKEADLITGQQHFRNKFGDKRVMNLE